jgi:mevalonate kinase
MQTAQCQAPGKAIILGEHFVVHGAAALAIPLPSLTTTVVVGPAANGRPGSATAARSLTGTSRAMLDHALQRLRIAGAGGTTADQLVIEISTSIPVGYGLGASAAFSVALVGALAKSANISLTKDLLNEHAHALEVLVHGTPSGIDDTVVAHGRCLRFRRGEPLSFLPWPSALRLVLARVDYPGSTREAVSRVARFRSSHAARFSSLLERMEVLAESGIQAFADDQMQQLGTILDQNHELLREVGVSTDDLDRLVQAARNAGALGAKLTGAGRGGFVLALVSRAAEQAVSAAMHEAGASQIVHVAGTA